MIDLENPKLQQRFWSKVRKTETCWEWTASRDQGYGQFGLGRHPATGRYVVTKAHRVAWEMLRGPRNPEMVIDHLCRNRACVNPDHLEEVTNAVNIQRSPIMRPGRRQRAYAREEFCRSGKHRLSDTAIPFGGGRICGACRAEWCSNYAAKRKAVTS